jgi:predicted signal transduction protein with EAL and GGDEF domain
LLAQVAQRFQSQLRDGETAARLGGDEFAVMISSLEAPYHAQDVADRLIAVLNESVRIDGRDHYISASIGITLYPNDGSTVDDLIKNADIAMYRAKELGRGRAVFYETELNVRMQRRTQIENALREAFRLRRCELHYQPVIDCASGACIAVEALIRWDLAAGANLWNTGELMAAADESGLIVQIGDWVVDRALRSFSDWRGAEIGLQYMSVNVSPRQLREPEFVAQIARLLRLHRVAPQELQIEITETVLSEGVEATRALTALAELGVKIALDDFGTGYSSLAYLRQYPINVIKIDQSFVRDLTRSDDARKLVETMLAMGRGLGKAVIAEGVETAEQYAFLIARGCDAVQGYWLARPMREVDLLQFRVPVMLTERKLQLG